MRSGRPPWLLVGATVGIGVTVLLVHALGMRAIANYLAQLGPGFAWVLAAYLLTNVVYSLPLGLALATRPSLRALVLSRLAAVSVNAATPFLGVGGEPVRLLWLAPEERRQGVAALVVDRSAFLGASALFLGLGVLLALERLHLSEPLRWLLSALAVVALLLTALLYRLQRRDGVAQPIARVLGRVVRRWAPALRGGALHVDDHVRRWHAERPTRFRWAVMLHLLGRFLSAIEIWAIAHLLGVPLGAFGALLFASVLLAVDLAFSLIPSQIGVHEGGSALLAAALGLDPVAGVALAFVQRLRQVVFVSLGFALLISRRQNAHAPA